MKNTKKRSIVIKKSVFPVLKTWLLLPALLFVPAVAVTVFGVIKAMNLLYIVGGAASVLTLIPVCIIACRIIVAKCYSAEITDTKIKIKDGFWNIKEDQCIFIGVYSVSVRQSFWGRIFNYGDVIVDCVGSWDVNTKGIKYPHTLKKYLDAKTINTSMLNIIGN